MQNLRKLYQTAKEYVNNKLRKLISFGNRKLPNTTAIFNVTSAHNCPSAKLGLCEFRKNCKTQFATGKNLCYALKAEKLYPDCLPYRNRQEKYFDSVTAEQFANDFLAIYARKRIKPLFIRFNEAGDWKSQKHYEKAFQAAAIIQKETGIISYCYTHRTDLRFYNSFKYGLKVMKSGSMPNDFLAAKFVGIPAAKFDALKAEKAAFNPLQKNNRPSDKSYFCPADCKKCKLCAIVTSGTIYAKIH